MPVLLISFLGALIFLAGSPSTDTDEKKKRRNIYFLGQKLKQLERQQKFEECILVRDEIENIKKEIDV